MFKRATKLRWRRKVRRSRRQVEDIGFQAEEGLEKHFIKRLGRLTQVRRFIASWVLLIVLCIGGLVVQLRGLTKSYQALSPVPGGTYTEGILGSYTNANPLYATGAVDSSVSRLIFAGLLKYNDANQLVPDLAESYTVDPQGTHYTVKLRPHLTWQDGKPLTAADVVFTYNVIQNPDAESPLSTSWKGIKISSDDPLTVSFILPSALSAFPHSLTNGIVPQHLLGGISMTELRSLSFNTVRPVGAGPFQLQTVEVSGQTPADREQRIGLVPFKDYHEGKPNLGRFVVRSFKDERGMVSAFKQQQINAMAGLENLPDELRGDLTLREYSFPLTSAVYVFFKNNASPFNDPSIRKALVLAANPRQVIEGLGYPAIAAKGPLLKGQLGYAPDVTQTTADPGTAIKLLDAAGWVPGSDGIRVKDGKPLSFRLYSENTSQYTYVTQVLQKQWRTIGIDAQVFLQQDSDLQPIISSHGYDALLYGISIGADPDVFAFWHSSQADLRSATHFNLSEYSSKQADQALEAGRSRSDPVIRNAKYRPLLEIWKADNPALALYQPRFLYITSSPVFNLKEHTINSGPERYNAVAQWMIRQEKVNK